MQASGRDYYIPNPPGAPYFGPSVPLTRPLPNAQNSLSYSGILSKKIESFYDNNREMMGKALVIIGVALVILGIISLCMLNVPAGITSIFLGGVALVGAYKLLGFGTKHSVPVHVDPPVDK